MEARDGIVLPLIQTRQSVGAAKLHAPFSCLLASSEMSMSHEDGNQFTSSKMMSMKATYAGMLSKL
jgi:hypothetical protein